MRTDALENRWAAVNAGNFLLWRRHCRTLAELAAIEPKTDNLNLKDDTIQIHGARVSASLFSILRVHPKLGRVFMNEEDEPGKDRGVILTDLMWRETFGNNPNIIGTPISLK